MMNSILYKSQELVYECMIKYNKCKKSEQTQIYEKFDFDSNKMFNIVLWLQIKYVWVYVKIQQMHLKIIVQNQKLHS